MVAVIAHPPVIKGMPIGLMAISSLSWDFYCSADIVLDLPTFTSNIRYPFRKNKIAPIISNASIVIPKKLKIKEPRIAKRIIFVKAVNDSFLAIFIICSFENCSVIITSKGVILMGLINVSKVVRQKMRNCVSDWTKLIITFVLELKYQGF